MSSAKLPVGNGRLRAADHVLIEIDPLLARRAGFPKARLEVVTRWQSCTRRSMRAREPYNTPAFIDGGSVAVTSSRSSGSAFLLAFVCSPRCTAAGLQSGSCSYLTAALRGRPPRRPFARELAALRSLVRRPTSAAAVTKCTLGRARPPAGVQTLAT